MKSTVPTGTHQILRRILNAHEPAFLRAVHEKNEHQIRQVVRRVVDMLRGDLYARTIAIFGLSFKPGTSDVRNSLAVRIIDQFRRLDLARLRKEVALPLIVDGVNALDRAATDAAGFVYRGIGRSAIKEQTDSVLVSVR